MRLPGTKLRQALAAVALVLPLGLGAAGTANAQADVNIKIGVGPGWYYGPGGVYIGPRGVKLKPWNYAGWYNQGQYLYYKPERFARYCKVGHKQTALHKWRHIHKGRDAHDSIKNHRHKYWDSPSLIYLTRC